MVFDRVKQSKLNNCVFVVTGSELDEGGDEQIYYMLVDEGSQLENQTILIDEAQLAAAGGQHGNVIIQVDIFFRLIGS